MKTYQTNEIKNIAIVGCSGSGKTTLTEAMLFEGGIIKRRGTIEAKNTVSDYFPVEQEAPQRDSFLLCFYPIPYRDPFQAPRPHKR